MGSLKKNAGILLIVLGALLLVLAAIIPALGDLVDYNWFTAGCAALVIIGLIGHILLNKYLPLDDAKEEE